MVDKRMSLTFSIRNNPGRYTLFLGSGVSTEAGIPTGWAIVEDLIRDLAVLEEEDIDPDPFVWYENKYGTEAAYDDLIGKLGDAKEDRRSLLEKYIEPSKQERDRDEKTPTKAHRSIAWLVDNGYINVIITTNFDHLLEDALAEYGVTPVVITGPESAKGAEPLTHQDAVIIKVNGDYKETDIKNLAAELEEYAPPVQDLIDQVFREYGLIVCGWSGKWDTRLREAIKSCQVHRYTTYWSHHGELEEEAKSIVSHRDGVPIQIQGASRFFSELKERVQALEGADSAAPLSQEVARERVKRYLTREQHRIDLADLIKDEAEEASREIFDEKRFPLSDDDGQITIEDRVAEYGNVVRTIITTSMTCAYWGNETVNSGVRPTEQAIQHIGSTPSPKNGFNSDLEQLRRYPGSLVMYGAGLAAIGSNNWGLIEQLLSETKVKIYYNSTVSSGTSEKFANFALHPWAMTPGRGDGFDRISQEKSLRSTMKEQLQNPAMDFLSSHEKYEEVFENFEAIADLVLIHEVESQGGNVNRLGTTYWPQTVSHLGEHLDEQGQDWQPIQSGLLDTTPEETRDLLDKLEELSVQ